MSVAVTQADDGAWRAPERIAAGDIEAGPPWLQEWQCVAISLFFLESVT
jgi:hypothetical protein